MLTRLIEARTVVSLACAAALGTLGLAAWPFPEADPVLGLIAAERPTLYQGLAYAYATVWFSTPYLLLHTVASVVYVYGPQGRRVATAGALPPYPPPQAREALFLVLGEQHHHTVPGPSADPRWLVIPETGLFTGMAIVGAIGTGKTTACIYPYVEQLLAYRASDAARKVGGLILDVKGDFARHVRTILERHGRVEDYVEVGLESPYRYNPLHNELDAYALAFGIATLMTNLYGRGKEPFWQQASTNLVKFVILLHQVLDGYVTLVQVYEHVINPDKLKVKIGEGDERFVVQRRIHIERAALIPRALQGFAWQDEHAQKTSWTPWSLDVVARLRDARIEYTESVVPRSADEEDRAARFAAVKRWFDDDWMRIEPKLRTSIVEGISVFLSLFDDNPRVKHVFCPPKAVYEAKEPATADTPVTTGVVLPPMAELLEQGKVVVLNFPLALNPDLARAVGTMLNRISSAAICTDILHFPARALVSPAVRAANGRDPRSGRGSALLIGRGAFLTGGRLQTCGRAGPGGRKAGSTP